MVFSWQCVQQLCPPFSWEQDIGPYLLGLWVGLPNEGLARRKCVVNHGLMANNFCFHLTMFLVQRLCLVQILPQHLWRCKGQVLFDPLLLCIQFKHKLVKLQWLLQCGATPVSWLSQCPKSAVIQNHSLHQEHIHCTYPSTNCQKHIPQVPHFEYFSPGVSNRKPSHWAYPNYRKGPCSVPAFSYFKCFLALASRCVIPGWQRTSHIIRKKLQRN